MKRKRNILAVGLSIIMAAALLTGCGSEDNQSSMSESEREQIAQSGYPIQTETKQTLKIWTERGGDIIGNNPDPKQYPAIQMYADTIGVDLDWTFAAVTNRAQEFNLLIASGDLPDIIGYYMANNGKDGMSGGPEKAIQDGWLQPMNDYMEEYAPDYLKFLNENPEAAKNVKTDSGQIYMVPYYAYDDDDTTAGLGAGYMFRKDWLDKLGLPLPETIAEWETALRAFKEQMGAEAPLSLEYMNVDRGLAGAFDVHLNWYHEGDTVKYGYAQPQYKDFLTTMNRWFEEGLLDKNYATVDSKTVTANMLNGKAGVTLTWSSSFAKWLPAGKEIDPDYDLAFVSFPVMNKGDEVKFGHKDPKVYFGGWGITQTSNKKELAMKVMNYGYTEEGREYLVYGDENDTFTIQNGEYTFTDKIMKNSDGLSRTEATQYYINSAYIPVHSYSVGEQARALVRTVYELPQQEEGIARLASTQIDKYRMPYVTPTIEESAEFTRLQSDIQKYAEEMLVKFITGQESLDNFDAYLAELETRGMSRLTQIMQDAYERFEQR